jgi:hypothetical protein
MIVRAEHESTTGEGAAAGQFADEAIAGRVVVQHLEMKHPLAVRVSRPQQRSWQISRRTSDELEVAVRRAVDGQTDRRGANRILKCAPPEESTPGLSLRYTDARGFSTDRYRRTGVATPPGRSQSPQPTQPSSAYT